MFKSTRRNLIRNATVAAKEQATFQDLPYASFTPLPLRPAAAVPSSSIPGCRRFWNEKTVPPALRVPLKDARTNERTWRRVSTKLIGQRGFGKAAESCARLNRPEPVDQ